MVPAEQDGEATFQDDVAAFANRSTPKEARVIIGVCEVSLSLPMAHSLKEKRGLVKPLLARLRGEFNVSVAEVEDQDRWQSAVIAVAMVAADGANLHGALEAVVRWIERTQPHLYLANWEIEIM